MIQYTSSQGATEVHVSHGGDTIVCKPEDAIVEADKLVQKHGGGVPSFAFFGPDDMTIPQLESMLAKQLSQPSNGAARSQADYDATKAAGFSPDVPIYERGTRVNETGVANARRSRQTWEKLPLVDDYTAEFIARIEEEKRADENVDGYALRMTRDGRLGIPNVIAAKPITSQAFGGLVQRLGYGGGSYLEKCPVALRQHNVNVWGETLQAKRQESGEYDDGQMVLRTRNAKEGREIFGAVTNTYTPFDCDKVAEAFGIALANTGARGRVTYDGQKARFEALFHSDIKPEDYVAGEFFKAGIIVRTDDTGGGSIRGNAVVWQNLCLNLIIIDRASQDLFRIRHVGSINELARRFRVGLEAGKRSLEHFRRAWGFAVNDDVLSEARKVHADIPIPVSLALPGLFRGILDRELVPLKGRVEENVKHLVRMWDADVSGAKQRDYVTRASVVNAFTRYAHEVNDDPWAEDEIQRSAGQLLYGRGSQNPAPLPWLDADR